MKRRADEYNVGELLMEFDGRPAGTIISMADDPYRITRAYLLTRYADGNFAIFTCLKDAMCEPTVPRQIPEQVMKQFLWDAFVGMALERSPEYPAARVPLLDPLPKYDAPMRHAPIPAPPQDMRVREEPVPAGEESCFPKGPAVSVPEVPAEEPTRDDGRMLPEFDFLF